MPSWNTERLSYGDSVISTKAKNSVPETKTCHLAVTVNFLYIIYTILVLKAIIFHNRFLYSEMSQQRRRRSVSHSFKIVAPDHALINKCSTLPISIAMQAHSHRRGSRGLPISINQSINQCLLSDTPVHRSVNTIHIITMIHYYIIIIIIIIVLGKKIVNTAFFKSKWLDCKIYIQQFQPASSN